MKFSGWIFLIFSWGLIIGLTVFCFFKVFSKRPQGRGLASDKPQGNGLTSNSQSQKG